jgi:transposase
MDQVHVIRHQVLVEGRSQRRVAKEFGISRLTVRKYIAEAALCRKETGPRPRPVWDKVAARVEALLTASAQWTGGKQRLTATRLHGLLIAEGHAVGVTVVKAAVAEWKRQRFEVFVPLTYRPGDLAEVDFFEVSFAITSRQALGSAFQRNQLAEKGDRSATRVSHRQRRRSNFFLEIPSNEPAGRPPRPATVACPVQSGGLPFVAVVQAADFGSHHDAAGRLDGAFHRSILAEREVRARPLVVRDVGPKDSTKMPLIEDDDVVQTLAADRADDAFDVGILPGRARCRADGHETEGLDRPTERRVEGRVAVVEEEPRVRVVGKGLAELLSGPCGRWLIRHIDMQDTTPVVGQDNEDE